MFIVPDGRCFLAAWDVSTSVTSLNMPTETKPAETEGYLLIPMFSKGLLIGKRPFQDGVMCGKNCPFQATLPTSSEDLLFFS